MKNYSAQDIIKLAEAEIGYIEKKSNKNLDDKTANAGNRNYTKYARDLYEAGYYQGNKQSYAWCEVWYDWLHYIASGKDAKFAQEIICQTDVYGAGPNCSRSYYKKQGRLFDDPVPGDQIFFHNESGGVGHTGLVYAVDDKYVYTIEGNTSSSSELEAEGEGVWKKQYPLSSSKIAGYGRPKYEIMANNLEEKEETLEEKKENSNTIELKILKKGDKGNSVKALQLLLNGNRFSCGSADGDFGNNTQKAVIKFQNSKKLEADGIVGIKTWNSLLN